MSTNYYNAYMTEVMTDNAAELNAFFSVSYADIKAMSHEERSEIQDRCAEIMDSHFYGKCQADYKRAYDLYFLVSEVCDDEYRAENESKVLAYFNKHFAGKSFEQIQAEQELLEREYRAGKRGSELPDVGDWSWYSDWHKDCFGFRPRIAH